MTKNPEEPEKRPEINFTTPIAHALKRAYEKAVAAGRTEFNFVTEGESHPLHCGFAFYMLEYLASELGDPTIASTVRVPRESS